MILNNSQRENKSEGGKKELDFDSVLEQLLSMSKDSPALYDSQALKTFAPKPKDKSKSNSNEMPEDLSHKTQLKPLAQQMMTDGISTMPHPSI